jgi:membrane protease YdiL (CAAX protease family)
VESSFTDNPSPATLLDQPKAAYPTIKQSWEILGTYLVVALGVGLFVYKLVSILSILRPVSGAIFTVLTEVALFLVIWRKSGGKQVSHIRLTGYELPWLYAALPVLALAQVVLLSLLAFIHLPNIAEASFRDLVKQPALALFVMCIAAPALEELVFRGIVLRGLLKNYAPWVAISQSALLFGLVHLNPALTVAAGFIGLLLGWLYYRTQSLWLCMAMHSLHNFLAFIRLSKTSLGDIETAKQLFGSDAGYGFALAVSALVVGLILWRIQQTTTPAKLEHALVVSESGVNSTETKASSV